MSKTFMQALMVGGIYIKTYRASRCISAITEKLILDSGSLRYVKSKNLAKDGSGNITLKDSSQKTSNNTKTTIKHNKILKMANIGSIMDPHINITEPSKDCLDSWSKKFTLRTIYTGANKMTSNAATIEFYDTVMDGVRETTDLKDIGISKNCAPSKS